MFVVSAYLYRKVVEDMCCSCLFVVLLPEIIMDIVLAIILSNQVTTAYLVLLFSILGLSSVVVVHSIYALWTDGSRNKDDDETSPDSSSNKLPSKDELDTTYFKGGRVRSSSLGDAAC